MGNAGERDDGKIFREDLPGERMFEVILDAEISGK